MDHLENLQKQDKEETDKATDALLGNAGDYSLDDHTLDQMIEAKKRETVQMLDQDDVPTVTDIKTFNNILHHLKQFLKISAPYGSRGILHNPHICLRR